MHDCFGKPLKPFDRVRAATKEEFEAQGHTDVHNLATLSPAEQFFFPGSFGSDTCNGYAAASYAFSPQQAQPGGGVELHLVVIPTWPTVCTARALVKLEG
jgi:hypothetical protein